MVQKAFPEFVDYYNSEGREACIDVLVQSGKIIATARRYTDLMINKWVTKGPGDTRPGFAYQDHFRAAIQNAVPSANFVQKFSPGAEYRKSFPELGGALQYANDIGAPDYIEIEFEEDGYGIYIVQTIVASDGSKIDLGQDIDAPFLGDAPEEFEP